MGSSSDVCWAVGKGLARVRAHRRGQGLSLPIASSYCYCDQVTEGLKAASQVTFLAFLNSRGRKRSGGGSSCDTLETFIACEM